MSGSSELAAAEAARLRRCLNDLLGVVALGALWTDGASGRIVTTMLDALIGTLDPVFAMARLHLSDGAPPFDTLRVPDSSESVVDAAALETMVTEALSNGSYNAYLPREGRRLAIATAPLGIHADVGTLVVGSERVDFPNDAERLILEVAANQMAVALQRERLLDQQRRLSATLEEQVARRTSELTAANEALRNEVAERQRAELAAVESERYSQLIVDNIPGLVALLNATGGVEFVNRQILEYSGKTLEDLRRWGTGDIVHPDDLPHVIEEFTRSIGSGTPYEIVQRLRRADGMYRWFQNSGFPLRDGGGQVTRWCVLLTDIDGRKRAEHALRASEREARLIVDTIPGLAVALNPSGEVDFVNQQTLDYLGVTFSDTKQWALNGIVNPEDIARVLPVFTRGVASGIPFDYEVRLRHADGSYRWFQLRANPLRDDETRIVRWYVLLTDIDERVQAEAAVRQRERESGLIVDTLPGLVVILAPDGSVEFENKRTREYLGPELSETGRWSTNGIVHVDDLPRVIPLFVAGVESGAPFDYEVRLRQVDGVYRWFQLRAHPLRDEGRIVRWYVLLTDIHDRKHAEDVIRASERDLKVMIDTIPAVAWSARLDGSAEFLNQQYLDFVGMSADEAKDWGWTAAVHPDDQNDLAATWQRIRASDATGETEARLRRHDGVYRWFLFRTSPLRDERGHTVQWYGINTDIDDRKRTETELKRSEMLLSEGLRLSATGTFSWRVDTDELMFSEELHRIFEFDQPSVTFDHIRERVHPEDVDLLAQQMAQVRSGQDNEEYEIRLRMPDQRIKYLRVFGRLIRRQDNRLECVGAVQDVTQRRRSEEALDRARSELAHVARAMSLSTLTASIAHEVNQPLSGIVTNASTCLRMLDAAPPNTEGARETARRTIRDAHRASDVVTRLRALYGKKEFTHEPVDLNEATREVIALSSSDLQRNRVILHSELDDDLPTVIGDRVQLQQIILNLVRNASDAMADVDDRPREMVVRTARENGRDAVRLSVRDSGVGIGAEDLDKVFDAFYTTKSAGMGIGLSVSRSIVERHHGRIWVDRNAGPGATFSFSIPRDARNGTVETSW